MKARQTFALVASLALLLGAHTAAACSAEAECVDQHCSESYGTPAEAFPYSVAYTTTGDSATTTFVFKVCSAPCNASDPLCKPLSGLRLRLSDQVLSSPNTYIRNAVPQGAVSAGCSATGPGFFVNGTQLQSLSTSEPANGQNCEVLSLAVYNPPGASGPLPLRDLCQQGVEIVDGSGQTTFSQKGASCLFTYELSDGTAGVGQLDQRSPSPPPVRSPPPPPPSPSGGPTPAGSPSPSSSPRPSASPSPSSSPSPSPSGSSPAPTPASTSPAPASPSPSPASSPSHSPSPRPVPSHSPSPMPYYGSRRLQQQAPFVRRLLASYGPSAGHRRLAAAEPLAFATRRLMEASAVPLPSHLTGGARHLAGSYSNDRRLSAYGGSTSGRRLASMDELDSFGGRTLSHYGSHRRLSANYGGSHRRLMSDVEEEATPMGRSLLAGGYSGSSDRRLSSADDQTMGRALLAGGYSGHRRLMGVEEEAAPVGRELLAGGNYGRRLSAYGSDRRLSGYGSGRRLSAYGSGHRRQALSSGGSGLGRDLLAGGYGNHH